MHIRHIIHFQIISAKNNDDIPCDPHLFLQNNQPSAVGIDLSKNLGMEKVVNVFTKIEEACLNEKVIIFSIIPLTPVIK